MFTPASKKNVKLKLALTGIGKAGKTWTSLTIAQAMGGKVAVVDTENGSASIYADQFRFDAMDMKAPYHPNRYIEAIREAQNLGYRTIVLDSLSHVWFGEGGILSIVDDIKAHSKSQNPMVAWNMAGTPLHRSLMDAIVQSDIHVIGTIRMDEGYILEKDERGKVVPTRVALKPVMKKNFTFEFHVIMNMDMKNTATVTGSRCPILPEGTVIPKPSAELGNTLMKWLVGAEWTDALDEKAVGWAAAEWKVEKSAAYHMIQSAVSEERLSAVLPKEEFKAFVACERGA